MSLTAYLSSANIKYDLCSREHFLPYRHMNIVERSELWRPTSASGGSLFVETAIIWLGDEKYFLQQSPYRYESLDEVWFADGGIRRIPDHHIYPSDLDYPIAETRYNRYIETPTCIEWDLRMGPNVMIPRDAFKRQSELVRPLLDNPHCNITQFYGCTMNWYWMESLVFGNYERCLADFESDEVFALNATQVVANVKSGIKHLHKLGIMHQAIYPKNIRFDAVGRPVIVNFRNADYEGELLSYEAIELLEHAYVLWQRSGNNEAYAPGERFGWFKDDHPRTSPQIDYFGLSVIHSFLRDPERYSELNQPCRKIYWDCRRRGHIGETCCEHVGRDFDFMLVDTDEESEDWGEREDEDVDTTDNESEDDDSTRDHRV